jgi:biopolymer transport protein ExbD
MRRQRSRSLPLDEPQTDVSSLVDVSFLLLIFFLVTSTLLKRENDLPLTLPTPGHASAIPALPLWIEVAADGSVSLGRDEGALRVADPSAGSSLEELSVHLKVARDAARPEPLPVVMRVADHAAQQRFIDVLNCLAGVGIESVTMVEGAEEF